MTLLRREILRPGEAGAKQTLTRMSEMVRFAAALPWFQDYAFRIVGATPRVDNGWNTPSTIAERMRSIQSWVRSKSLYTRDNWDFRAQAKKPGRWEKLTSPEVQLGQLLDNGFIVEDCDGSAMLVAALLLATGTDEDRAKFTVVATRTGKGSYNHVLTQIRLGDTWVALDTLSAYPALEQTAPPRDWGIGSHA